MKRSPETRKYLVVIYQTPHCEDHLPTTEGQKAPLPEVPERVQTISNVLMASASVAKHIVFQAPSQATDEELEEIHKPLHLKTIHNAVERARELDTSMIVNHNSDVVVTAGSELAAKYAAGAVRDAVRFVISGRNHRAFCNVRPPGHHAECAKAAGFCLYNNVWFGAQSARYYLIASGKPNPRIAIIDWDVHHGDGTQSYVIRNPELFTYFVSIHQQFNTQWPMTGKECEKIRHNSVVVCHNVPVDQGDDHIHEYFTNSLVPKLIAWKPDLIMISCGFDAHVLDPIGQLKYSSQLYGWMTEQLCQVAEQCCEGRVVSVLEGGYSLEALKEASVEHVKALAGISAAPEDRDETSE